MLLQGTLITAGLMTFVAIGLFVWATVLLWKTLAHHLLSKRKREK